MPAASPKALTAISRIVRRWSLHYRSENIGRWSFETYWARPETSIMAELSGTDGLYLDDLQIGQRFTSGTYVVDEE
jgi:hypothetical protein